MRPRLEEGTKIVSRQPRVLLIGALVRGGRGAVDLCTQPAIPDETLNGIWHSLPKAVLFPEIVESDILVKCTYLPDPISPFIDEASLASDKRHLSVKCDVSCDTTKPHNAGLNLH